MSRTGPVVTAIIAARNEGDVIGHVARDLAEQGARIYLIDDGSTDGTVAEVERYAGASLIGIDRLPPSETYGWSKLLARKEALARELDSDWFIHADADEFREAPWPGVGLVDAIAIVDGLGWNAIDFAVLDFWPTHDDFRPGDDVREAFARYAPGETFNVAQVRCWKKGADPVDLVATGGHDVAFPGRMVFPTRFLLRHYPIRGQAHGERKVHLERVARFAPEERERGWHIQYDGARPGASLLRDPATLRAFDPVRVRAELALRPRTLEDVERGLASAERDQARLRDDLAHTRDELAHTRDELAHTRDELARARRELARTTDELARTTDELARTRGDLARTADRLRQESAAHADARVELERRQEFIDALEARVRDLLASLSWRLTRPLRQALDVARTLSNAKPPRH